ncbi:AbrB/MazE/SpoVT family DNA-binding domain-containing protein [soil metagenome]
MQARIQKWGNRLAVRIPRTIASEAGMEEQTDVEITFNEGVVMITRTAQTEYTLDELLQNVTESNLHTETNLGPVKGKEVW